MLENSRQRIIEDFQKAQTFILNKRLISKYSSCCGSNYTLQDYIIVPCLKQNEMLKRTPRYEVENEEYLAEGTVAFKILPKLNL